MDFAWQVLVFLLYACQVGLMLSCRGNRGINTLKRKMRKYGVGAIE
jgi:hypothetical protein